MAQVKEAIYEPKLSSYCRLQRKSVTKKKNGRGPADYLAMASLRRPLYNATQAIRPFEAY